MLVSIRGCPWPRKNLFLLTVSLEKTIMHLPETKSIVSVHPSPFLLCGMEIVEAKLEFFEMILKIQGFLHGTAL